MASAFEELWVVFRRLLVLAAEHTTLDTRMSGAWPPPQRLNDSRVIATKATEIAYVPIVGIGCVMIRNRSYRWATTAFLPLPHQ